MGFSFNWQGLTVPQGSKESNASYQARVRSDAAALGNAARGYVNKRKEEEAAKEYAGIISSYGQNQPTGPDVSAIQQEIQRLKARNAEIAKQLGM